jgi:hypothetical protein
MIGSLSASASPLGLPDIVTIGFVLLDDYLL